MSSMMHAAAGLCILLSSLLPLEAQENGVEKISKPSSPELLILPVGEPPVRKLKTVKDSDGQDRLENVAPPKQWMPPEKVIVTAEKDASPEVFLQANTLSSPVAYKGTEFSILLGGTGGSPLTTARDASTFSAGVQSRLQLCVMKPALTSEGPDWTRPQGMIFNSDWSLLPVGSFRVINMSSFTAMFQTAKTKVVIPPAQCRHFKDSIPNGSAFLLMVNTPKGEQRVRQTSLDLPQGTRGTMVIYDKSFDKRHALADVMQFIESP